MNDEPDSVDHQLPYLGFENSNCRNVWNKLFVKYSTTNFIIRLNKAALLWQF